MKKRVKKNVPILDEEHPIVAKKINDSLKISVKEGSIASTASAVGESYFPPFALALNATASQVGILHAIISLLPGIVQLKSSNLIEFFSRKKIVLTTMAIRVCLWIPIILTGLLFYLGYEHAIWVLIVLVGIYYSFMATTQVMWFSWMGSLVPEKRRGKYFSRRNKIMGLWGLIGMIVSAFFLDFMKARGMASGNVLEYTLIGFGFLFLISMSFRYWTMSLLKKQYEPRIKIRKRDHIPFWRFLGQITETPFGKFVFFRSLFTLVISIASPFWAVYMLRDLGFSYVWFIGVTVSGIAFQLIFFNLMGKMSDRFGNISLIRLCTGLFFLIPFAWLASTLISNPLILRFYLLIVPSLIAGFSWAGYNLATNNYVYDAVSKRKTGFGLSFMNFFGGVGAFIGATLGSWMASLDITFMNPLLFIFLISGIGRLFVFLLGFKHLEEVRHVKHFSSHYMIREFTPMKGIVREIHHLEHVVKKVEHFI